MLSIGTLASDSRHTKLCGELLRVTFAEPVTYARLTSAMGGLRTLVTGLTVCPWGLPKAIDRSTQLILLGPDVWNEPRYAPQIGGYAGPLGWSVGLLG